MGRSDVGKELLHALQYEKCTCKFLAADKQDSPLLLFSFYCFLKNIQPGVSLLFFSGFFNIFEKYFQSLRLT